MTLKLCNAKKSAEASEQRLKKLTDDHEKALKMIQYFVERQEKFEDELQKKERKIVELQVELSRPRSQETNKSNRRSNNPKREVNEASDDPERDECNQVFKKFLLSF